MDSIPLLDELAHMNLLVRVSNLHTEPTQTLPILPIGGHVLPKPLVDPEAFPDILGVAHDLLRTDYVIEEPLYLDAPELDDLRLVLLDVVVPHRLQIGV